MAVVANLIKRTRGNYDAYEDLLEENEKILSHNKVTGYSVNFPIAKTCQPSKVCMERCYFAKGGSSWPASLKKQLRLYNSTKADPLGTADRLIAEINGKHNKLTYLRWNGGGDLFAESVEMLHACAEALPELPFWVVTRIPEFASQVKELPNLFVHFSLDGKSLDRMEKYEAKKKLSQNYFYSYQCDKGEMPKPENLKGISVVFFDGYHPTGDMGWMEQETICPLNTRDDITNTCEDCRRCFDNSAVKHFQKTS